MGSKPLATLALEKREQTMSMQDYEAKMPPIPDDSTYMTEADDPAMQSAIAKRPHDRHICPSCGAEIDCEDINQRVAPLTCEWDGDYICTGCELIDTREQRDHLDALLADCNAAAVKFSQDLANRAATISNLKIALACLLEWAKGLRGTRQGNPYAVPEVRAALEQLADCEGISRAYYLDVDTRGISGG